MSKKSSGKSLFGLFLLAIIACGAAAYILFPEKTQALWESCVAEYNAFTAADDANGVSDSESDADRDPTAQLSDSEDGDSTPPPVSGMSGPDPDDAELREFRDELEKAQELQRAFKWQEARIAADTLQRETSSHDLKAEARNISQSTQQLESFMNKMSDKVYGLHRGIYASGLVVQITYKNNNRENVMPIVSMTSKDPAKTTDPVAYLNSQLAQAQAFVMNDRGIRMQLSERNVDSIDVADMEAIKLQLSETAKDMYRKLNDDPQLKNDPVAIYNVAQYAYRVGLDKPVTRLLERALALDKDLAQSVAEDHAHLILEKLEYALSKQKNTRVKYYYAELKKDYRNTRACKQASALIDGSAHDDGGGTTTEPTPSLPPASSTPVASGNADMRSADAFWKSGQASLYEAMTTQETKDTRKDELLRKAFTDLTQAWRMYVELADNGNEKAASKAVACNQDRYSAKKHMRPE